MTIDFDNRKDDLIARADRGVKFGKSLGAEALEIFIMQTNTININIQAGVVDATNGGAVGLGVRSVEGNKIGFASSSGITDDAVNFAIEAAVNTAKALDQADERWKNFVTSKDIGKEGIIDASIVNVSSEEIVNGANQIFKEAREYDPRIVSVNGSVQVGYGAMAVVNSEGVAKASRATGGGASSYLTAVENGKNKTGFDFTFGRSIPEFDGIGLRGAEKAIKALGSKTLGETGPKKVIFNNFLTGQFVTFGLINSVNGRSVVEGRSRFADKIGDVIGDTALTIVDDGQIPESPTTHAIDMEGNARRRTEIVKNGILMSFLFDEYYGSILGEPSTGNANRGGQQPYEALPNISPTTLSITPGSKNLDELITEIGDGVLVNDFVMGLIHSDVVSGNFSVVAPNSFKIENGEITVPLEQVTIAGNLYDAFNQVIGLSDENEVTPVGKVPSIAYDGFTVTG